MEIYDSRGTLILKFATPTFWDEKTSTGADIAFGYYLIKVNGEHKLSITLVR